MTDQNPIPGAPADFTPLNRIRVETALSRFPIHRLAKKGSISIDLQRLTDTGEADFKWEVTYNVKHGQPGPLAYKVDTLIVNRRIDEARRPLPEFIKLGSLTDICTELRVVDSGENRTHIRKALHQNASAYITAKIRYKLKTGRERWGEIGYTRYSVVFTGEILPSGNTADAVYVVINPSYRDLLNHVEVRPLDYNYLIQLSPGSQRFYELLSFQMYGAVASGRPRAKMLYSDYCKYAPQTRYHDFNHMKKQMYKVHLPHRESGYIVKVDYQETLDATANNDWEMLYTPGSKAIAEYRAFTTRQLRLPSSPQPLLPPNIIETRTHKPIQTTLDLKDCLGENKLLTEMIRRGVTEKKARELVMNLKPGQELMDQLEYVDHVLTQAPRGKFHNPSGFLVKFIEDNAPVPDSFGSSRKQRLHHDAEQAGNVELSRLAQLEIAYEDYQTAEINHFISNVLPAEEYKRMFDQCLPESNRRYKHMTAAQLHEVTHKTVRTEIKQSGRVTLLSRAEFCQQKER